MTTTAYLELEDQANGDNDNTWGDVADTNMSYLELAIARRTSIATTGGTTVLSSAQNRYPLIVLTGVLASSAVIEVKTQEKNWYFVNNTTGNYTVQVKTSAGTGPLIPRGRAVKLYCDGTNVLYTRLPSIPFTADTTGSVSNAYISNYYPAFSASDLTNHDGTPIIVNFVGSNTSTVPTLNVNGTGAKTIVKDNGQPLLAYDIPGPAYRGLVSYNATTDKWVLMNPRSIRPVEEYIVTLSASGGVAFLAQYDLSAYAQIKVTLINVAPATDNTNLLLRLHDGASFTSTDMEGRQVTSTPSTAQVEANVDADLQVANSVGNAAEDGYVQGTITITNFNKGQKTGIRASTIWGTTSGVFVAREISAWHKQPQVMSGLALIFNSGDIASGSIIISGIRG